MGTPQTWAAQAPVKQPDRVLAELRAAGLPLAAEAADGEGEGDRSDIVCVASVGPSGVTGLVATPSGLVYRFQPAVFEPSFWSFAARCYYLVTGNLADRRQLAELTGVPIEAIKGRALLRGKAEALSHLCLDVLLDELGVTAVAAPVITP